MTDGTIHQVAPGTLADQIAALVEELAADAPTMGEEMPEGEVLAAIAERLREILNGEHGTSPGYFCAECGTTTAQTYVVTTLDPDDERGTRTEVCRACDDMIRAES